MTPRRFPRLFVVLALFAGAGCGLTTQVRPTPKGEVRAEVGVGGPAALLGGAPVPLPLSAAGVAWGFGEASDLSAHVHLTTLLAASTPGFDVGGSWLAREQAGAVPALCLGWRAYVFTDFHSGALGFADLSLAASWQATRRLRPYAAVALQLGSAQLTADWGISLGTQIALGRHGLQVELRWFAPNNDVRGAAVEWLSPFKRGAIGLVLGGQVAFAEGI